MAATYRGTTLPEAKTSWGSPTLAFKTWGFFGANGENYMHGGTRGRRFSVSGICPITSNATFSGWKDGSTGSAVIDGTTYTNVVVLDVTFGNRFKDAQDSLIYNVYQVFFLDLRP